MSDYPLWTPYEMSEAERLVALRWALGLEPTDETQDVAIRAALADAARWDPGASEHAQRYHALTVLHRQFHQST
jgi:hypothetical protein